MATYAEFASQVIGEAISDTDSDVTQAHISNYMVEGAQVVVNAMPKEMLWAMETNDDFVTGSTTGGVSVGSNKILQVVRLSDNNLLTVTNGVGGVADTTPTPSDAWQVNKQWTNVQGENISTVPNGVGFECAINTDGSGNPEFFITNVGTNYASNNVIRFTDPGSTNSTANITVSSIVASSTGKSEVECREIPAALIGRATPGSGWQEESSETDPVYYKLGGKVNILPTSTSNKSKVYWVKIPPTAWESDAYAETYMAGTILKEIEPLIMLYVLSKCYKQKLAIALFGADASATQGSTMEQYIADEDLDMAQGQQLLITDLQAMVQMLEKEFQMGIQLLMEGTYKPELIAQSQTQDTYAKLQGRGS